jgi:hypothetical protein
MGSLSITLSLFLSLSLTASAQSHDTLWNLLLQKPGQPIHVMNPLSGFGGDFFDTTLDKPILSAPIKMGDRLYLWFNATGRLYEMKKDITNGGFRKIRMDSTTYVGYNYQAFPFVHDGTIYNIGGYGYWRRNGHLRSYVTKSHQWEVNMLNQEIPITFYVNGDYLFYDVSTGHIYNAGYQYMNEGVKGRITNINQVMQLNIRAREWKVLGDLSPLLKQFRLERVQIVAMNKQGLLIRLAYKDFKLLSFRENKIYSVDANVWDHFSFTKAAMNEFINFFIDSTLYSYHTTTGKVDAFPIHASDLIDIEQPIYTKPVEWGKYAYWAIALFLFVPAFVFRKRLAAAFRSTTPTPALTEGPPNSEMLQLDSLEEQVLQMMYWNTAKGINTTIDELNNILGLARRNADVQKKLRSDCIQSINRKLSIRWGIHSQVIDKKRAEFDKRSFEYFIAEDLVSRVKELLFGTNDK